MQKFSKKVVLLVAFVLVLSVAGVVSAADVFVLDDFTVLDGFSTENRAILSHNTDPEFVKEGTGSLRVDKEAGDHRSMTRLRNYHPNFKSDLSAYNRFGVWFYIEDPALLQAEDAFVLSFWLTSGSKVPFGLNVDEFEAGWNHIVIDITQNYFNRLNVDLIEFQVRTADGDVETTYYYDEVTLWNE